MENNKKYDATKFDYRMNLNQVKFSSNWYPSNLVEPIKCNGGVFQKDKIEVKPDAAFLEEMKKKDEHILNLRNEIKNIQNNPVNKLSSEHDDLSYIPRLTPLYRTHISKNL